ncbi:MAG: 3'-5' exonuclease [Campylobacterota bacterium]|nr:3'-5' exonuclease [Campylobacterota bacterium]
MSQWMISEDKLSEEQRQFIDVEMVKNNNIWIKGFAGSGKSILLIHGIHDLVRKNKDVRICIIVFTNSLKQLFIAGLRELNIPNDNVYICTYHQFKNDNYSFDYIFCDEVQDLPKSVLEKMKLNAKQVITGGDSNQSIYENDPQTKEPTVTSAEISNVLNATAWDLNTIYRLTKSVIKTISSLLPSMNILSSKTDNTKKDVTPILGNASNKSKEVEYIISKSQDAIEVDENVVIILPTHNAIIEFMNTVLELKNKNAWDINDRNNQNNWGRPDFGKLNQYLTSCQLDIEYIGNGYGNLYESGQKGKIIVMTYHSSKGLDFDNVFLPFLNSENEFGYFNETLFMVGMTRSKFALQLTYSGTMHKFVKTIKNDCTEINLDKITNDENNSDDDFDF